MMLRAKPRSRAPVSVSTNEPAPTQLTYPAVAIEAPTNVQQAPPPPPLRVEVQKFADGVFFFVTPNARNWAVDFGDHIVVVEGQGSDARSLAVIEEIKKAIPNKPNNTTRLE